MSESVIYCEGYHDRAFWTGWLKHLGCVDPGLPPPGRSGRNPIFDPWNARVVAGQFAFHSASGLFIRVFPCGGKNNILREARLRLADRGSKTLARLVINIDSDVTTSGAKAGPSGLQVHDVVNLVRAFDAGAAPSAANEIDLDGGATKVSLLRWEASDPPAPGLPDQQTLERLACAAIIAAYPARAAAVQSWLHGRPIPPKRDPKEHAWSYMAGWYAESGCDFFYSNLWNDPQIAAELETRLQAFGAWRIATTLAS